MKERQLLGRIPFGLQRKWEMKKGTGGAALELREGIY
jgi:hypothetical protein